MIEMMKWHHRIPRDQLPTFLQEYRILHFVGREDEYNASDTVYELYHVIFDDHSDRKSLSSCLGKGETLSIWEKEKPTAICAITFVQRENAVLVLFLATKVDYQANGMATFLLSIMHQVVRCRVGVDEVNVYLKANPTANKVAWGYYSRRNFAEMAEGTEAFPKVLRDCFVNEVDDSPLKDYLGFSNDLKWLTICLTREYFAFPQESRNQIVLKGCSTIPMTTPLIVHPCMPSSRKLNIRRGNILYTNL
ncbi:hypothetical protein MHU86_17493 [Fragilaria crotonensis]|nr:hypothetical protein MHU86_17493 [Fragilaria crotonensis]